MHKLAKTMPQRLARVILARCLVCLLLAATMVSAQAPEAAAGRVVAIADIHGAFNAFQSLLRQAEIMDAQAQWAGGNTQLVIVGDVLDRGADSRAALELIIALQEQAPAAGGRVWMVLGNHEVMNLTGDLRYVAPAEFAAYQDLEEPGDRSAAYARFQVLPDNQDKSADTLALEFKRRYPPGFFGHYRAFSPRGKFGAWLLQQPVMTIVNDTVFVHAGLSARVGGQTLARTNQQASRTLQAYANYRQQLIDAGALAPETGFYTQAAQARAATAGDASLAPAAAALAELSQARLFAADSSIWYRGGAGCSPAIEQDRLELDLARLDVRRQVIGHTPTPERLVLSRFDGQVIRADTGMLADYYGGRPAAVVIAAGEVQVLYPDQSTLAHPLPQARRVGDRPGLLSDGELEALFLASSVDTQPAAGKRASVEISAGEGQLVNAVFLPAAKDGTLAELAAYRLDRMLGLDLVPVVVAIPGGANRHALGLDVSAMAHEGMSAADNLKGLANCPLPAQFGLALVFDMLIGHPGRQDQDFRYSSADGSLVVVGNGSAFGTGRRLPRHLRQAAVQLPPGLADRLAGLNEKTLESAMGGALNARQLSALLARRDQILKRAAAN
ncbi:MAG: metallophosphoesterase [Gammaproteobacteria bacterium]